MRGTIFLIILAMLLVACSETTVVQLEEQETATETQEEISEETTEETGGSAVSTSGKVPVKCDDSDAGSDAQEIGMTVVDYSDGTSEVFYDECVSYGGLTSDILTEYFCEGNSAKTKIVQCTASCMMVKLNANPNQKVGFCN